MKPALLLLNGPLADKKALKRRAAMAGIVVCADGGVRSALAIGVQPRVVVGDFDSLPHPLPKWKGTTYLFDDDEDLSDFEKALRFLSESGSPVVWVAGLWGGRPDHQLVNLAVFEKWSKKLPLAAVDPGWAAVLSKGRHVIPCPKGAKLSLLAVDKSAVVSAKGLKYPLKRFRLERGSRGLSNEATASPVEVVVEKGRVWAGLP